MTLEDYGKKFFQELKSNKSYYMAECIINEINSLIHEDTKQFLTYQEKQLLVNYIRQEYEKEYQNCKLIKKGDNSAILVLIAEINAAVGKELK